MRTEYEATAKTSAEAVNIALSALGVTRGMPGVEIEVLEKERSGFLGIGAQPAKVRVTVELSQKDKAVVFLTGLLEKMELTADVLSKETEEGCSLILDDENNTGMLIGRHGETLDALQYLTNIVANRDEEEKIKFTVDANDYRKGRTQTLEALAAKMAGKAVKYRRNFSLDPMNANERRIIHSALQDVENISTYSTGNEPNRRIIVVYTGPGKQENPHRGNNGYGRSPSRTNRNTSRPSSSPRGGYSNSYREISSEE